VVEIKAGVITEADALETETLGEVMVGDVSSYHVKYLKQYHKNFATI
jgi:hypothetical protein